MKRDILDSYADKLLGQWYNLSYTQIADKLYMLDVNISEQTIRNWFCTHGGKPDAPKNTKKKETKRYINPYVLDLPFKNKAINENKYSGKSTMKVRG